MRAPLRRPSLTILVCLLLTAPAVATALPSPSPGLDQVGETTRAEVAELFRPLDGPWPPSTLEAAVTASTELAGVQASALDPAPALLPVGLPAELATPVAQLLGAIEAAEPLTLEAVPPTSYHDLTQLQALVQQTPVLRAGATSIDLEEPSMQDLDAVRELVDQRAQHTAALTLARAIDQALPALHAAAGPASADPVEGCDVLDALPAVCIGSEAANTYTQDAVLLLDLGGDDLHLHGAGAANPLDGRPVSITLDLGGDDTYRAPGSSAHGIGSLGAVGILVDEAGDDAYIAQSSGDRASVTAQGNGVTGAVGILADRAGNDTYLVESQGITTTFAAGQARASNAGLGLLLDSGDGEDTYTLRAAPERPFVDEDGLKLGGLNVNGQALTSIGGVAILADGGGPHAVTLEAIVRVIEATEEREVQQTPLIVPAGMASGSIGGVSAALHGDGPATYTGRVTMQSTWTGIAGLNAIAQAGFRGAAMLSDAGGDTVYRLDVRNTAARDATGQPGIAEATMGLPNWAVATARGMGATSESGLALLDDDQGDDLYTVTVLAEAWAIGETAATATANPVSATVQAATSGGLAILQDGAGDDAYLVHPTSRATATTTEQGEATAIGGQIFTNAQAAAGPSGFQPGSAILRDEGGGDTYETVSESTATAAPAGTETAGGLISSAQGSVSSSASALLHDLDDGQQDTFVLVPAEPACTGVRGEGLWLDCGGAGGGWVDDGS